MPITRIITGGQSGADLGGWLAAEALGIMIGGTMPKGFRTEDGPRPEYAGRFGAVEDDSHDYPPRTRRNVADSDGTVIFMTDGSPGTRLTIRLADELEKPRVVVSVDLRFPLSPEAAGHFARWAEENGIRTLNVAGPRESESPGIGAWVATFLALAFGSGDDRRY